MMRTVPFAFERSNVQPSTVQSPLPPSSPAPQRPRNLAILQMQRRLPNHRTFVPARSPLFDAVQQGEVRRTHGANRQAGHQDDLFPHTHHAGRQAGHAHALDHLLH